MGAKLKIYHGTISIAGIGGFLAHFEQLKGHSSDFIPYVKNKTTNFNEKPLGTNHIFILFRPFVIAFFFLKCLFKYDTFHFYFGETFLPFNLDLPVLRLFGKKIIMTYCGSEVRLIDLVDRQRNPYTDLVKFNGLDQSKSSFVKLKNKIRKLYNFKYNHPDFDKRKVQMMKFQNRFIKKFIAIRDNYAHANYVIPEDKLESNILINNISVEAPIEFVPTGNSIPVIAHAPTHPEAKGSLFIERALNELESEGVAFEYVKLHFMPFKEAQNILKNKADIIIDQLLVGSFGSISVEAMSYAKPVVCYIMDDVLKNHCHDVPIYNANPDNIKEKLRDLILNQSLREELGKKGSQYIEKYYNKEKMINRLLEVYQEL